MCINYQIKNLIKINVKLIAELIYTGAEMAAERRLPKSIINSLNNQESPNVTIQSLASASVNVR